jgi:hypothetical protein
MERCERLGPRTLVGGRVTAWIPDVVPDQTIESAWGNTIRDRTITPFANAAARNTAIPAPKEGMTVWLDDTNRMETWDGAAWVGVNVGNAAKAYRLGQAGSINGAAGVLTSWATMLIPADPRPGLLVVAVQVTAVVGTVGSSGSANAGINFTWASVSQQSTTGPAVGWFQPAAAGMPNPQVQPGPTHTDAIQVPANAGVISVTGQAIGNTLVGWPTGSTFAWQQGRILATFHPYGTAQVLP